MNTSTLESATAIGPPTAALHSRPSEGDNDGTAQLSHHLRCAFDLAPIGLCFTQRGAVVWANAECVRLVGCANRAALIGRLLEAQFAATSRAAVRGLSVRPPAVPVERAGAAPQLTCAELLHPDGSTHQVSVAVAAAPQLGAAVLQWVITDISARTRERLALECSRRELQRLTANQVDAREAERRHIAREMHDELGQRLTSLKMELSSMARARLRSDNATASGDPSNREQHDRISAMLEMVDDTVASVRRIATDLRPLMLDDLGLNTAIEWHAREAAKRYALDITLDLDEHAVPTGDAMAIALYRIVQEALTNVARHAHASKVHIRISHAAVAASRSERDLERPVEREGADADDFDGALRLTITDDGVGYPPHAMRQVHSHGLIGIRERALSLGGHFDIGNAPGSGARVSITLPWRTHTGALLERRSPEPLLWRQRGNRASAASTASTAVAAQLACPSPRIGRRTDQRTDP